MHCRQGLIPKAASALVHDKKRVPIPALAEEPYALAKGRAAARAEMEHPPDGARLSRRLLSGQG